MLMSKQEVVVLIGPPCVGKSTYRAKHFSDHFVVSSDAIVHALMQEQGKTYGDFFTLDFHHPLKKAYRRLLKERNEQAKNEPQVLFDMTHVTYKSRQRVRDQHPDAHWHGVVFGFKGREEDIIAVNRERKEQPIPEQVLRDMFVNFEPVQSGEFHSLTEVVALGNW